MVPARSATKITGDWKPTKVTSNFVSQIRLCSPVIYKQFEENAAVASKRKAEAECPSIRNFFRKSASVCVDAHVMEDAIVKYIILDMRPLNSVEQAGFIYLLDHIQQSSTECGNLYLILIN